MNDKYQKPGIEYVLSVASRKLQTFLISSPEFMFLAKIIVAIVVVFAVMGLLKIAF